MGAIRGYLRNFTRDYLENIERCLGMDVKTIKTVNKNITKDVKIFLFQFEGIVGSDVEPTVAPTVEPGVTLPCGDVYQMKETGLRILYSCRRWVENVRNCCRYKKKCIYLFIVF